MSKTVVLIRCLEYSAPVAELTAHLRKGLPHTRLIAVPDLISKDPSKHESILSKFPIETAPLTKEFVEDNGLPSAGSRTGWLCGDYVFYRVLEFEWDYAWVIEPDVHFLNGSLNLLPKLTQFKHDLIATNYGAARESWTWFAPLSSALPDAKIYAMTFPLLRMSRQLAQNALDLRKKAALGLPEGVRVPNDESVVATAANYFERSVLDIKKLFPAQFKYWTTTLKLPIEDIAQRESEPRVVHSAVGPDHFMRYLLLLWKQMAEGNPHGKEKLLALLDHMSPATLREFLTEISQKRLDGDHASLA